GKSDPLESLERFGAARDLHAQDRPLPGGEEEFGKLLGREGRRDLARGLGLGDASGEGNAPFGEDLGQARAQHLALRRGLKTEITDRAAAAELGLSEPLGDDVEIALEALARRAAAVGERVGDEPPEIAKIAVEHLTREFLLRAEMVGERDLRGRRL